MDLTEQTGNLALKIGGKIVSSGTEFIAELIEELKKRRCMTLADHMKNGGVVYTSRVLDDFVPDMKRHLTEQNVVFAFLPMGDGDNAQLLVVRDADREKAKFATKLVLAEHGQVVEFEKDEFVNITPMSELACVSGLNPHEYELFREKAKDNGLKFAATIGEDNKVNILYNFGDRIRLDKSLKQVSWNLSGRNGDEYEAAYRTRVEAQETIKAMYRKQAQPMYIVDARHPERVMKVDKEGLSLCMHYDKQLSKQTNFENGMVIKMSGTEYVNQLNDAIAKIEEPVVITEGEFKNRDKVIQIKFPKLDKEWEDKESVYRDLYDEKVTIEKDYKLGGMAVFEHQFSFTEFVEQEVTLGENKPDLNEKEMKEVDEHVRASTSRVQKFEYYQPQQSELQKILNEVKQKKSLYQAKDAVDREKGKQIAKENQRNYQKNKNDERE